jgi:hypothetical protein
LLVGGIGLLGGTVKGIMVGVAHCGSEVENVWLAGLIGFSRFVAYLLAYAVVGTLMGAAVGGVIDYFWFG